MNDVLGGTFTSRINMNLREDKHWTYGARSRLADARGPRPFIVSAPVQSDKTKEAILEIDKELRGITGDKPVTPDELANNQKNETLGLAGRFETMRAIEGAIREILVFGLSEDYYGTYPAKVLSLRVGDLSQAARAVVHPDQLVWVVVGDRAKIQSQLRELGFGEIRLIDVDGKLL